MTGPTSKAEALDVVATIVVRALGRGAAPAELTGADALTSSTAGGHGGGRCGKGT